MAIWKEQTPPRKDLAPVAPPPDGAKKTADLRVETPPSYDLPRRAVEQEARESLIAAGLTIEGKIEGTGHVRLAGRFKGDVQVQGNLSIEAGAKLTGSVRARTVVVGGELEGNIDAASSVELLATGVLNGDLKAASLTVAAGSRMRGQVEFGWDEKGTQKSGLAVESDSAA
jgi:cytoskeletal protein CcmA (bactofilin family)